MNEDCDKTCKDCKFYQEYKDDDYIMKCSHDDMIIGKYDEIKICKHFSDKKETKKLRRRFKHQWQRVILKRVLFFK